MTGLAKIVIIINLQLAHMLASGTPYVSLGAFIEALICVVQREFLTPNINPCLGKGVKVPLQLDAPQANPWNGARDGSNGISCF